MKKRFARYTFTALIAAILLAAGGFAYAQGGATSTLSGTVTDTSGAVVPGADITVKNDATGTTFTAVSGADGSFLIPAIPPGTYTATVHLEGFKTVILKDIMISVGVPANIKAKLELGGVAETVVVGGATEVVQTQQTSVVTTMTAKQIANIPLAGRAAFDLVNYVPGVASSTGSLRDSQVNGLPQSAVNITLDGMNIQDNYAKTWDGMFTRVNPRLDAVEEVTVSTAAQGADMAGQGAVQVKFVTRSGTNKFQGSGYYYFRRDWMNTNTWFNIHRAVDLTGKASPKPTVAQYQPGGRLGGPIVRDRAFFFVNYEESRSPGTNGSTRTIMSPSSEQGLFKYSGGTVDLLALAARNGQVSTIDPTIAKLIADVRASTALKGTVSDTNDPLVQSFFWQQPTHNTTKYPTVKLDYNITSKHRATFSMTRNNLLSDPDTTNSRQTVFPGFAWHGLQDSKRYTEQGSVRSTLTKNLVNEARFGATGGATLFSPDMNKDMWSASVGNMNGYGISWSNFRSLSNAYGTANFSAREASTKVIEDTLSWMNGKHAISMGASFTRADVWLKNQQLVPTLTLANNSGTGLATGDPADSMFTAANFPGSSSTDRNNAGRLYAILTGRIYTIGREARIGTDGSTFNILGQSFQQGRIWHSGGFVQDSWRWKPNLTINAGLRYDVETPFFALNNSYSMATVADLFGVTGPGAGFVPGSNVTGLGNLYKPGVLEGSPTTYKQLNKGSKAYNTDRNNFAPSIGLAWTIGSEAGMLHKILGNPGDSVIRGGYNVAYQRGGMNDFTEIFGGNPGIQIDASRSQQNNNLGPVPVLLRSSDLSAPSNIPTTRVFPMSVPTSSSNVRVFDPNIKLPWASSYTIGWQRALSKTMSVEARLVHTDSHDRWTLGDLSERNYNELNIVENGFLDEFRIAQANLFANVAAGNGETFKYTGAAGTRPLPILFAHIQGAGSANDPTLYKASGWTDTTLVQSMYQLNPNPFSAASRLRTNYRTTMLAGGLPTNFWVVNPDVNNAYMATNGPDTRYNGLQLVLNRRFSQGLLVQANYAFGKGYQHDFYTLRKPYVERKQTYTNSTAGTGNVNHVFAANWVYELPFGRGKRFGGNANALVNRIIGNWNFQGVGRFQSGRMVDFGNVRLVGFTEKDLQKMFKLRLTTDPNNQYRTLVYILPQDIIDNTMKAFSFSATGYSGDAPTGRYFMPANGPNCIELDAGADYGDCGAGSVVVTGPKVIRFDMNLVKQIPAVHGVNLEFQVQVFNVFNRVNFNPNSYTGNVLDSYQVTGAVDQSRTGQLAFRISW